MVERHSLKSDDEPKDQTKTDEPGFYLRTKEKGLDYNIYGNWQINYTKMVVAITDILARTKKANISLLDAGTACGVQLRGFRETGVFKRFVGIDIDPFMVDLGRKTHGFTEDQLYVCPITGLRNYFKQQSVDLIHCAQTLEHIPKGDIPKILRSFKEIVTKEGCIFIMVDAILPNHSKEVIAEREKSHITVETAEWWEKQIGAYLTIDHTINERFAKTKFSPDNTNKTFYDYYKDEWTIFLATR